MKAHEDHQIRNSELLDTHESSDTVIPALNDDQHRLHRLEFLSKDHLKIPITKSKGPIDVININRAKASNIRDSLRLAPMGKKTDPHQDINVVMKHEYLRRSMEQRVEQKALESDFRHQQTALLKNKPIKMTRATSLRSQSVLNSIKAQG